jgi:anti-sigma-K factor RskA
MTDATFTPRDEDDLVASEYVLGVLDLKERSAAEARIKRDPAFAAMVQGWELRFAGLNDGFDEAPAPNLLPKIESRLFPPPPRQGLTWRSPLRWVAGAITAAAVVLVMLATVTPPKPNLIATLATADNRLSYEVRQFGDALRVTRIAGVPAVEGQVHELWVIAPGSAPVSLGLLQDEPLVVAYPSPPQGVVLAVSVEPVGGSPTGQPTGPVILTAKIASSDI